MLQTIGQAQGRRDAECSGLLEAHSLVRAGVLYECAERLGCVTRIRCTSCNDFAAYQHERNWAEIQVCRSNSTSLDLIKHETVRYEEMYHALSICAGGTSPDQSAITHWIGILNSTPRSGRGRASWPCAVYVGKEAYAQTCARLQRRTPDTNVTFFIGEIPSSGEECDHSPFGPGDQITIALNTWVTTQVVRSCGAIDAICFGLTRAVAPTLPSP